MRTFLFCAWYILEYWSSENAMWSPHSYPLLQSIGFGISELPVVKKYAV